MLFRSVITATTTGGVGELANFIISCGYVIPCALLFTRWKHSKAKTFACFALSTLGLVVFGIILNYFVTVPLYATLFGGKEAVIGLCSETIPMIDSLGKVVILGITPFNLVKGIALSLITIPVYYGYMSVTKREN